MTTNAITMARGLRSAGMEPKIAEAVAEMVATHSDEHLATKADLARLEGKLTGDITRLEGKLTADITRLEGKLTGDITRLEGKLTGDITHLEDKLTAEITSVKGDLTGKIEATTAQNKMLIALAVGIYVGLAMLFINGLAG